MKALKLLVQGAAGLYYPIKANGRFFLFMYVLGVVCGYTTVQPYKDAHIYPNTFLELFLDLYVLCLLLCLLPHRLRKWVRRMAGVVFYGVAIIDVYCFVKFQSTLNPAMLLLAEETDMRETGEFFGSYVSAEVLTTDLFWVLLIPMVHFLVWIFCLRKDRKTDAAARWWASVSAKVSPIIHQAYPAMGILILFLLIAAGIESADNKAATWKLMSGKNIGEVEHTLTEKGHAELYLPIYRLTFSIYANSLAAQQIEKLRAAAHRVEVDSCSYRSPDIVLIIGESYNKHHSELYGYNKPTTPKQKRRARSRRLVPFTDVVSPWNLTSFVFKHLFSLYSVGDKGEWCDYPLFPELFRKAGYHVTFITNQFLPKARQEVYDFSGGFFLNDPILNQAQFDTRNDRLHIFDEDLLNDYETLKKDRKAHNLTIFHLMGQHVSYRIRSPKDRKRFTGNDYDRPELGEKSKQNLAEYDNAVLYNDSIVDQILKRFEHEEAIVIYVPDHGEEVYGPGAEHFFGRMHSTEITARLAREEFEIPFWIWCSPRYLRRHADIYRQIVRAKNRPYMTDALPHLLLYLAGIETKYYKETENPLSKAYDAKRPRILKASTDYDKLMETDRKEKTWERRR